MPVRAQHVTVERLSLPRCVLMWSRAGWFPHYWGHWLDSCHQDEGDCVMSVYLGDVGAEICVAVVTWGEGRMTERSTDSP